MVMFSLLLLLLFFGYQNKFAELHLFSVTIWPPGYPESTLTEADGKMSRTGSRKERG